MYADNHQICASHQLIESVATLLNNKAKIVSDWYENNFLLANKGKFQAMFLASKAKNAQEAQPWELKKERATMVNAFVEGHLLIFRRIHAMAHSGWNTEDLMVLMFNIKNGHL